MGATQSSKSHKDRQDIRRNMTFDEFLELVSVKADELSNTLKNLKEDRRKGKESMSTLEARGYLAYILTTAESDLHHLNISYIHSDKQLKGQEQLTDQAWVRVRYPEHRTLSQEQQAFQDRTEQQGYHNTGPPKNAPVVSYSSGDLQRQLEKIKAELSLSQKTVEELKEENKILKNGTNKLAKQNEEYKREKDDLLFRLSKLTSDKLTADNPNIADLSDPNRPTKLVEMMSELYDNQWTDAFEALQTLKNDDKLVVKILLQTFMDIFNFCKDKSRSLVTMSEKTMKDLFEDVNATMKKKDGFVKTKSATLLCRANGKEMTGLFRDQSVDESNTIFRDWRDDQVDDELERSGSFKDGKDILPKLEQELKKIRKDFGVALVPIVTKAYLKPRWSRSCVKALKPYIKKCFYVAWMMCVQTPPMALAALPKQGDKFDADQYTAYSNRGSKIDYVVWPAVLLKEKEFAEKAVLMRKGVANGKY